MPFVPSYLGQWLRWALFHEAEEPDDPNARAVIPIDLDLIAEPSAEEAAKASAPPATPAPAGGDPQKAPAGQGPIADAGAPHDASVADASPTDAAAPASSQADAGPAPLRDPMAAAGGAGQVAAKDPNVQILIAGNVIRKHELGASFGRILVLIPEWRQFFAESPIDPIRDMNHILITAPRLRGDFSKMVVVMDFNVPDPQIRAAVDIVVQRANGAWLDDTPVPAARARIAGGDRIFALPGKKLLVLLPQDAQDQLSGLKQTRGFKNGTAGIVISMVTPSRAFRGIFPLPETIKWMRLAVTPTPDGSADVTIEGGDKSPAEAEAHAEELTRALDQVRTIDMVLTRVDIIDHVAFGADKDVIRGQVHVTARQLKFILGAAEQQIREQAARRAAMSGSAPPGAPALPGSATSPASPGAPASPGPPGQPAAPTTATPSKAP